MNPEQLAAQGVRKLTPYLPGKPIGELERELGISNIVKLASNENPLGPSPKALAAIQSAVNELQLYPDGGGFDLKAALAAKLKVGVAQITLGNGSNDVLELVARAFLSVETSALFSQHAFAVYPIVTQAIGATACVAKAHDGTRGIRYGHDLEAMASLIDDKTRVIFIANPNNPTGTFLTRDELGGFLRIVPDTALVVVDEAYFEYVNEPNYPNALEWLDEYPNLIVTRTFSKAYGLAGLRVGYAISSPGLADLLNRVRQPFNVNSLALVAAAEALSDDEHLKRTIELNLNGLAMLEEAMGKRGLSNIPSLGNFLTIDVGRNASPVYEALLREGVIVRPIANYGLPNHLRVTVGTESQNQTFLAALDRVLGL